MARTEHVVQLRKGILEIAILALLRARPRYGAELVDELARRPVLAAGAGTVYPLLTRLRSAGQVSTYWQESPLGPPRKYYSLTRQGEAELDGLSRTWHDLTASLADILQEMKA